MQTFTGENLGVKMDSKRRYQSIQGPRDQVCVKVSRSIFNDIPPRSHHLIVCVKWRIDLSN